MIFQQIFEETVRLSIFPMEDQGSAHLCSPRQVHGTRIVEVTAQTDSPFEADGLYTRTRSLTVGIRTADCLPFLLWDGEVIGAVHAGWRGLSAGILESFFMAASSPGSARVFVGPAIGACCYPVGEEVSSLFPGHVDDRGHLDLRAAAVKRLIRLGIAEERIYHLPWCTCCDSRGLPSYRREGSSASRILSTIVRLPTP